MRRGGDRKRENAAEGGIGLQEERMVTDALRCPGSLKQLPAPTHARNTINNRFRTPLVLDLHHISLHHISPRQSWPPASCPRPYPSMQIPCPFFHCLCNFSSPIQYTVLSPTPHGPLEDFNTKRATPLMFYQPPSLRDRYKPASPRRVYVYQ